MFSFSLFLFSLFSDRRLCSCSLLLAARLFKGLHVLVNVLFLLAGAGLIAVGAYVVATNGGVLSDELSNTTPLAILVMSLGGFIFVISFIGCCGAARESRCLLNTYSIILILLLAAQIGIGVYAFVHRGRVDEDLTQQAWRKIDLAARNKIEDDFKCCGWLEYDEAGFCSSAAPKYARMCAPLIKAWVHHNLFILAMVALGVAAIQIFGLVISCCLSAAINASHKAHDRERLLNEARAANRMPYSSAPPPAQYGNVQQAGYAGYGYQK